MARELSTALSNPCVLMFGNGITFAPSTYSIQALDGSVFRGSVDYRSTQKQVISAITQETWKTLSFEIEGPNRIVWGRFGCALVRVGAPANAAVNAPTAPGNARTGPPTRRRQQAQPQVPRRPRPTHRRRRRQPCRKWRPLRRPSSARWSMVPPSNAPMVACCTSACARARPPTLRASSPSCTSPLTACRWALQHAARTLRRASRAARPVASAMAPTTRRSSCAKGRAARSAAASSKICPREICCWRRTRRRSSGVAVTNSL